MAYAQIACKLLAGLIGLIIITRLLGKKEMSQLTPFDFVYALVLGGILEEGLYDQKVSIKQILFAFFIWGAAIYIVEKSAQKNGVIRNLLKGNPSLIIENGQINVKELRKNQLDLEQLRTMMRKQGVFTLREVRDLYLEPGGNISIQPYAKTKAVTPAMLGIDAKEEAPSVLVIEEGKIKKEGLQAIEQTKDWLYTQLKKDGYEKVENILYAEWSKTNGFYVQTYR